MRRSTWVPAAAVVVAIGTTAACGSGGGDAAGTGGPRTGGTLTFAVGSDAGCVDPQQVGSNDTIYSVRQLVDSLTDQDPSSGRIVPWLARSWQVGPDARTFTFHLRPGVTFSDGTPLTAAVVKANFDAVPKLGALGLLAEGYLSGYTGTTVVDDLTAKVTFKQPNAQFLQATATHSLGIVAEATTRKTPQQRCAEGVVGSGPFVLSKYVPNQEIALAKRRGYAWGSSLWRRPGEAYLDRLVFRILPESGVRTGALQSGQVDAIGSVGRADEAALKASGVHLQARANPGIVFGLSPNNARSPLNDEKVRQAISLAIDRRQIADTVFPAGTRPATSVLAHTTPGYTDLSAILAHDQAKAAALLDQDGWAPGSDGVRQKNGAKLRLTATWFANAGTNQPTLELIQQQLKAVGVQLDLRELPITQLVQVQQSGGFDLLWGNITRADPDILRSTFSTHLANTYHLPKTGLDAVLDGQAAAADPAKRLPVVAQAQQEIARHAYTIPVVELQTELGVARKVHDLRFDASSRIQLHDTWIG
ncbi:ABC transporter substrate-binding protein [Actinoallomurus rhizosphaericola]|uniref:ABC transporter substrate-binding protein n=1 Tax=Actinoallomurus rhizosphaericola TaxID=2952536 RepID=UPI0020939E7C|nr:ABC transporter substrate-binding protein [Actinoallomurus rhizosphaericola]MCO5995607.1 ABC transporter substrate-binding protein [Actinoallomurus rhizosphaericola]